MAIARGFVPYSTSVALHLNMPLSSLGWPEPEPTLEPSDFVVNWISHDDGRYGSSGLILMFLYQHGEPWS
jgi:hypothetical protein